MKSCTNCKKRDGCTEICDAIEKQLPKPRSGGNRKEFTTDPQTIDQLMPYIIGVRERLGIRSHNKIHYTDNWERD